MGGLFGGGGDGGGDSKDRGFNAKGYKPNTADEFIDAPYGAGDKQMGLPRQKMKNPHYKAPNDGGTPEFIALGGQKKTRRGAGGTLAVNRLAR